MEKSRDSQNGLSHIDMEKTNEKKGKGIGNWKMKGKDAFHFKGSSECLQLHFQSHTDENNVSA